MVRQGCHTLGCLSCNPIEAAKSATRGRPTLSSDSAIQRFTLLPLSAASSRRFFLQTINLNLLAKTRPQLSFRSSAQS
ncbi:hypothetical protein KCV05_g201, partial [Aureobasidium melanogenum]